MQSGGRKLTGLVLW